MLVEQTYQTVALADVRPHPANPRRGDVASIVASVDANGFYGAMIVQKSTGLILAGNHRFYAAQESGMDVLPAIVVDVDDDTARRILVVDNRSNDLASYDDEALAEVLREIAAAPGGLAGSGFDGDDLDALIATLIELPPPLDDPDAVPAVPAEPVSVLGDVWLLGPHRVVCGDSTDVGVWDVLLDGSRVDCVWTDPPYGVSYQTSMTVADAARRNRRKDGLEVANDTLTGEALQGFLIDALGLATDRCKPGACWYVAAPSSERLLDFAFALRHLGLLRHTLVWVKDQFVFGRSDYHYRHETIFYGWVPGAAHHSVPDRTQDSVWEIARPKRSSEHPTMKPVGLITRALENSTDRGALVADPFGGSGSTLIACHVTGRVARLIELDPGYVDVICRRYQDATGTKPVLESTGEPHDFTAVDG